MEGLLRNVELAELPDTIGTPPSTRLVDSLKRQGIIQSILVAERIDDGGEIRLEIIDGNRRVAAARKAKFTGVPAFVLSGLSPEEIAQWTLAANGFRTANYLTEFEAIRQLKGTNYSLADIRKISGMADSSIELRSQLSGLNRELLAALHDGRIAQAEAISAAKLHPDDQEMLTKRFRERGRITKADFRELFPPDPGKEGEPSQATLAASLRSAVRIAMELDMDKESFLALAGSVWDEAD